jgi:hypothetical protein
MFEIKYLELHPQVLSHGLADWAAASSDLDRSWQATMAEIQRLTAAAPWGDDDAGLEFSNAYLAGPTLIDDRGTAYVKQLSELGDEVRQSAEHAIGMDAEQARAVKSLLNRI